MGACEALLARVLTDEAGVGDVIVLRGSLEETQARFRAGRRLSSEAYLAAGNNTREEATACFQHQITDLTIVTSAYHSLRAFLTFLQVAGETGQRVRITSHPVGRDFSLLEQELQKIATYQTIGHVASYEAGLDYFLHRDAWNYVTAG